MSDPTPPLPPRNGWLTALMIVVGIILLLPGLCSILFSGILNPTDAMFVLWAFGLASAAVGIFLIWRAIRGRRS